MFNKKIFLAFVCMLFLAVQVSAGMFESKTYDEENQVITVDKAFLGIKLPEFLGGEKIADVKLETPVKTNYDPRTNRDYYIVSSGYTKIAELNITAYQYKEGALGEVEFYDVDRKNGDLNERAKSFDYKFLTYEERERDTYAVEAFINKNGTQSYRQVKNGTEKYYVENWQDVPSADLNGTITVGIFTNVEMGDYIEWIATLFGVRATEWATYQVVWEEFDGVTINSTRFTAFTSASQGSGALTAQTTGDSNNMAGIRIVATDYDWNETNFTVSMSFDSGTGGWDVFGVGWAQSSITTAQGYVWTQSGSTGGNSRVIGIAEGNDMLINWDGTINATSIKISKNGVLVGYINKNNTGAPTIAGSQCCGATGTATFYQINITATVLNVLNVSTTLVSPANATYTTNNTVYFQFYANATNGNLTNATLVVRNLTTTRTNFTTINPTLNNSMISLSLGGFGGDYGYNWTAFACATNITGSVACNYAEPNRTLFVDTVTPLLNFTVINNVTVSQAPSANITLFINQTDANPGYCWYTNITGSDVIVTCGTYFNTTAPLFGDYTLNGYANDTLGHTATQSVNFTVITYNASQSTATVAEGGSSTFTLIINGTSLPTVVGTLRYNNTNYAPTTQVSSTNGTLLAYTLTIPTGWGNSTGRTQYWNWTFNLAGIGNTTTGTQTQSVLSLTPIDCSTGGDLIFNFTQYDEETRDIINASAGNNLQVDLTITSLIDSSISVTYNNTVLNEESLLVCLPSGVLDSNSYRVDLVGSYLATDYVQEFFYIDNGTISSSNIPQEYAWYDLLIADSTTFLFTFLDENGIEVPNAIVQTLRYYIGQAEFLDVERSKTDNNGETHIHLVEEDVIYIFNISLNGAQIFISDQYNAKCLSTPCAITLSAQPENDPFPTVYNNLPEGSYRIVADVNTREVTLYFNLNESALMNFTIWTSNNNEDEPVVSGTTMASAGAITVEVPLAYGNATYTGVIYMDGGFVASQVVELKESASDYFGAMGLFLASLAVLCLAFIGSSQGEWVIVWTVMGVVASAVMFMVDVPWYGLMTLVAGAGILLMKLVQRRRIS